MFGHSPMYTRKSPFWVSDVNSPGRDGGKHFVQALRHSLSELLGSGVTTVVDIQAATEIGDLWCATLAESGIRAYVAPWFQEAFWRTRDGESSGIRLGPGDRSGKFRPGVRHARHCRRIRRRSNQRG